MRTKLIITILILIFASSTSLALSIPEKNTNAEITFSGFEWYSDYNATIKAAEKNKFKQPSFSTNGMEWDAPHWTYASNSLIGRSFENLQSY